MHLNYYKYENNSSDSMIIYEKKIINNERGLNDNIIDKKSFLTDIRSFKTGLELSKEYYGDIN